MQAIILALVLFAATFVVHWLWWRIRLPQRQTMTLLKLFLAALPIGLLTTYFVPGLHKYAPRDVWDVLLVAQFHVACTLSYTCINSALQHDSPSLMVVTFVGMAGPEGRSADEVGGILDDDLMIRPRLAELLAGGMIVLERDRYRLTPRGRAFTARLALLRRLFRLEKGG